jgi:hypothetical protein
MSWFHLPLCCCGLLHPRHAAFSSAVFKAFPQHQAALLGEVTAVLASGSASAGVRGPTRLLEASDADGQPLQVQVTTGLVLQLVQVRARKQQQTLQRRGMSFLSLSFLCRTLMCMDMRACAHVHASVA